MEEELKCPICRAFLRDPILLQCGHAYCRACALKVQQKVVPGAGATALQGNQPSTSSLGNHSAASDTISLCISDGDGDSVVSETDSGVICATTSNNSRGSRPSSFVGSIYASQAIPHGANTSSSRLPSILTPSISGYTVNCEHCHKPSVYADENALRHQPEAVAIRRILQRFRYSPQPSSSGASESTETPVPNCQWCEGTPRSADLCCDVCNFFYCTPCQTVLHPSRGPLKDHLLVPATSRRLGPLEDIEKDVKCERHLDEVLTMYCTVCKVAVCCHCIQEIRHTGHEMQSLVTAVKGQKNGLSKTLQHLSEKVRNAADEVSKLKQLNDKINANCEDYKAKINIQIDALIEHLQERRQRLQEFAEVERDSKKKALRDQINRCTSHLNKTTALMQLCIEVLKEPDAVVYLQIGQQLNNRASTQDFTWNREMRTKTEVDPEFVLSLDTRPVQSAIQGLEFAQLKSISCSSGRIRGDPSKAPSAPQFDATECCAENNSVTVVWNCPSNGTAIDGYTLEIDSGRDDGHFREVYTGPDNICTIDGLHFDTIYNVRVKAFNSAGESGYSDPIGLQTAHVAWFQLTKSSSQRDVILSNERATLTGVGLDYRVVLGNVAFSRGVHYWEVTVDQFDGNGDIVIGVAQPSVNRHTMLGKDLHGWAMYIDDKRSWYIHNDAHHGRIALHGGTGAVLGVLMDCDQGVLSFYVNDRRLEVDEACYAFKNMPRGLYYPAFSVNKNAKITVHTGLVPPTLRSSTSDDSVTDTL